MVPTVQTVPVDPWVQQAAKVFKVKTAPPGLRAFKAPKARPATQASAAPPVAKVLKAPAA